jgi:hypothetical protein
MKVINPLTNRLINVDGPVFNQLLEDGYKFENKQLIRHVKKPIVKTLNLIDNILIESSPNDLLSLYLTDNNFKNKLNSPNMLKLLNEKYNVMASNFIQFFRNLNIKHVSQEHHKTLYLYHLENTLYKPLPVIENRIELLVWVYDIFVKLELNYRVFGLAITLFDKYAINSKQVILTCLYIATYMLNEYADIDDYYKILKMKKSDFIKIQEDIITKSHGYLIRPSTVFFTEHEELSILSYFSNDLLKYKPSLIAETINYLSTGDYKIYTLTEMSEPCKLLKMLMNDSPIKHHLNVKRTCANQNKIIKNIIVKKPNLWHIGQYEKLKQIGEGAEGIVYKIRNKHGYYVLKTVTGHLEPVSIEISVMKLLVNPYIIHMAGFNMTPRKINLYLDVGEFNLYDGIKENKFQKPYWKLIKNIVRGVNYCHYNDIIHRDLKPENIVYDGEKLKLIDFGLAVPYASFKDYLDPELCSTLNYRAPEALLGDTHYNYKIDIWAIGLIIYFMIKKNDLFKKEPNIFQTFGTPTDWKEATLLPDWKKTNYKKKIINLGEYTEIFKMCTVLNPAKRATTASLLSYIEYKI